MISDIFLLLLFLLLSAFFSGMEIAFLASNKLRIELEKNQGKFSAKIISFFNQNQKKYLTTLLIGNNVILVIYGIYFSAFFQQYLKAYLLNGIEISRYLTMIIETICSTFMILIFAEFLPKSIGKINPNHLLTLFFPLLWLIYWIFYPLTQFILFLSNTLFQHPENNKDISFTRNDLNHFIEEITERAHKKEDIDHEIHILKNALEFSYVKARDCMVPRTDFVNIELNEDIQVLENLFIKTGFSKILIYKNTEEETIGYVHSLQMFNRPKSIKSIFLPIFYIPETIAAPDVMEMFLQKKKSIALVVNEFGSISGMLTIEDVIEKIFGAINDEYDTQNLIEEKNSAGEYIFSGRLKIDELNHKYQFNIETDIEYETLAGYIIHQLERIPNLYEEFELEPYKFKILEVTDGQILKIQLKRVRR